MEKRPNEMRDFGEVFDEKGSNRPNDSTEKRIKKLESAVRFLFGFLGGAFLTRLLCELIKLV